MGAQAPQIVSVEQGQIGPHGEILLARGVHVALRLWNHPPGNLECRHQCEYETVGYVIEGRLRVTIEGETADVGKGQSWLVPAGAEHCYEVLEPLQAIEATSPPSWETDVARVHAYGH